MGLRELDQILRGQAIHTAAGQQQPTVSVVPLLATNLLLAAFYGVCMGIFGLSGRAEPEFRLMLADAFKVPLLFLLTLFVTFPSLYVFNALVGSRLGVVDLARLMTASLAVLLAVLAAFGPIVGFFSITTTNYPFILLLNVAVFVLAAIFGLSYLTRTFDSMLPRPIPVARRVRNYDPEVQELPPEEAAAPAIESRSPPPSPGAARAVLRVWLVAFALVGAQMSWVLRPFIGWPGMEFTWFRPRESSFFEAVLKSLRMLFGG